jgi:aminopeptidase
VFAAAVGSPAVADPRFTRLAELLVGFGANVQPGQIVAVMAYVGGHEELARAVTGAAYRQGAKFVDVAWFDPLVKRERIAYAAEETLDYVPPWYGQRVEQLGELRCARISFTGTVSPHAMDGLDPARAGKDQLPFLKEIPKLISERTTNWCGAPCPTPAWAQLVFPDLPPDEAYDELWRQLEHVLRLDEPDPVAAWEERIETLVESARKLTERRFDAMHLEGPGTDLTVGLLPTSRYHAAAFETVDGIRHMPNLPTEEVFTSPDPERSEGHVTATKPLVLRDGTIIRGLRVRFEGGRAVAIDADENAAALRSLAAMDEGASRLGELALVDRAGRIGPLGTVFYDTLLDENAASHIAIGNGFAFAVGDEDLDRVNTSGTHIDFMIGSDELDVTGITAGGERVPVLRGGAWQL